MIFVDTGGWFASVVTDEADHLITKTWFEKNRETLITTDYIVDETLTLLRARKENRKALQIGELFFNGSLASLHYLSEEEILETWQVYKSFSNKDWSFTDCASKVIIEKFGITHAFSFDKYFRQFGGIIVVP